MIASRIRTGCTVGSLERMLGLPAGTIRNENGRDTRSDKRIGTGSFSKRARRLRADCTVGSLERMLGLPAGTIRNANGRDTRSDKRIGTIRKEALTN